MNFPAFIQVREKYLKNNQENISVEAICQKYLKEPAVTIETGMSEITAVSPETLSSDLLDFEAE